MIITGNVHNLSYKSIVGYAIRQYYTSSFLNDCSLCVSEKTKKQLCTWIFQNARLFSHCDTTATPRPIKPSSAAQWNHYKIIFSGVMPEALSWSNKEWAHQKNFPKHRQTHTFSHIGSSLEFASTCKRMKPICLPVFLVSLSSFLTCDFKMFKLKQHTALCLPRSLMQKST